MPAPIRNWDGPWLIRVVAPPMAALLAEGIKPCELMATKHWLSWGVQGSIVTAIYQGSQPLTNANHFMPKGIPAPAHDEHKNGMILAILVLGSVGWPTGSEVGWYQATTPRGSPSSMHRVLYRYKVDPPITPESPYLSQGGLMQMRDGDIRQILKQMQACSKPRIFERDSDGHLDADLTPGRFLTPQYNGAVEGFEISEDERAVEQYWKYTPTVLPTARFKEEWLANLDGVSEDLLHTRPALGEILEGNRRARPHGVLPWPLAWAIDTSGT